jgi:hypothetical protein
VLNSAQFRDYFLDGTCRYGISNSSLQNRLRENLIAGLHNFTATNGNNPSFDEFSIDLAKLAGQIIRLSKSPSNKVATLYYISEGSRPEMQYYRDYSLNQCSVLAQLIDTARKLLPTKISDRLKDLKASVVALGKYVEVRHTLRYGIFDDEIEDQFSQVIREMGVEGLLAGQPETFLGALPVDLGRACEKAEYFLAILSPVQGTYFVVSSHQAVDLDKYKMHDSLIIQYSTLGSAIHAPEASYLLGKGTFQ